MHSIETRQVATEESRPRPHDHAIESPTLSEAKKKTIRSLQLGSLAMQTAGTAWEIVQNGWGAVNTRILLLMAHDVNDVAGWELDLRQDHGKLSEAARRRTEKMAHWAIAGGGAYTAAEGGAAAAGIRWHEGGHNLLNMLAATGATGVAAVTTGLVAAAATKKYGNVKQLWRRARAGGEAAKDKKRLLHAATDFLTAGAVLADTTEALSSQASGALAALGGLACAVYFRPTKKNLELGHVCAAHGHGEVADDHHDDHSDHHHCAGHTEHHGHETVEHGDKKQLRKRRAARLGVVAAAVAGGVMAGAVWGSSHVSNTSALPPPPPPTTTTIAAETATIQSGDTIWGVVRDHVAATTGEVPSEAKIFTLVQETARINADTLPNPDVIYPGDSIVLPLLR